MAMPDIDETFDVIDPLLFYPEHSAADLEKERIRQLCLTARKLNEGLQPLVSYMDRLRKSLKTKNERSKDDKITDKYIHHIADEISILRGTINKIIFSEEQIAENKKRLGELLR